MRTAACKVTGEERKEVTTMPRLRASPEAIMDRSILGQLSDMAYQKYGQRLTGAIFARMFGVGERTGQNRMKELNGTTLRELRHYVRTCSPSDSEILEWFGR